jgi:cobalt-precorrin-5B (C1)-methyltransferase
MEFMASLAKQCGASEAIVEEIRTANTARHVSEIVSKHGIAGYSNLMCQKVHQQMAAHAGAALDIQVIMFEFDGTIVGRYPN